MVDDNDIECVFCGFETNKSRITKVEVQTYRENLKADWPDDDSL